MANKKKVGQIGDIWQWKHGWDDGEYHNYHLLYLQDIRATRNTQREIRFIMLETGEYLFLKPHECFQNTTGEQGYWEEWKYIS